MSAGQQGLEALAVPPKLIDYHSHAHRAQDWLFHDHKQLQTLLDKAFTVYSPKGSTCDRCDSCVSPDPFKGDFAGFVDITESETVRVVFQFPVRIVSAVWGAKCAADTPPGFNPSA